MGQKMRFPISPSGELFTGDGPVAAGDNRVVPGWNPDTREWEPVNGIGGSGATLTNLSNVLYLDQGTTVPAEDQTGNIEAPFQDFQTLLDYVDAQAMTQVVVYATIATYGGELGFTIPDNVELHLIGMAGGVYGGSLPGLGGLLTLGAGVTFVAENFNLTNGVTGASNNPCSFLNCFIGTLESAADVVLRFSQAGEVTAPNLTAFGTPNGSTAAVPTLTGGCAVGALQLEDCVVQGTLTTTGDAHIVNTSISEGDIAVTGDLFIDLYSLTSARENGAAVTFGSATVLDAPSVSLVNVNIPAFGPGVEYIPVAFAGAVPGDTFAVAWQQADGVPAIEDVAWGAPFCNTAGTVQLPLISPTATLGGGSINAIVTRFTVGGLFTPPA